MRRHGLLAAAAALSLAAGDARADGVHDLIGTCFARAYDAAYLAGHGDQQFAAIKIGFSDFNDTALARIDLTTRTRVTVLYYFANCATDIAGGVLCRGCAGDSCEPNGETFEIKLRGEDHIEFVNGACRHHRQDGGRFGADAKTRAARRVSRLHARAHRQRQLRGVAGGRLRIRRPCVRRKSMKRYGSIMVAAAALLASAGARAADGVSSLSDQCFAREYDAAHLAKHPDQAVNWIAVDFIGYEDSTVARLRFTTRQDPEVAYFYSADCGSAIAGGAHCGGCANDSCEDNGEAFKILLHGKDAIELVNDETGITAVNGEEDNPRQYKLAPGGEHRVFVLERGNASGCGE